MIQYPAVAHVRDASVGVARGEIAPVNWLDFLILALVAWLTLSAYMTGLIREAVGLASVILGVAMAGLFHDNVATNLALLAGESSIAPM